jgi:elongation factor P
MISTNDFKTGQTIELEGDVYQIIEFQHVKPGKGSAFVRSKLRNVRTGAVIEKTFNAGEKIPKARIEKREVQYLYNDGKDYNFMDMESYDQIAMTSEQLGDSVKYLKENMLIQVLTFQEKSIGVELPNFIEVDNIVCDIDQLKGLLWIDDGFHGGPCFYAVQVSHPQGSDTQFRRCRSRFPIEGVLVSHKSKRASKNIAFFV